VALLAVSKFIERLLKNMPSFLISLAEQSEKM
jgi:hypothetical protein